MTEGHCQACGEKIGWIKTKNNKQMPVDLKITTIVTEDGRTEKGYSPHWAGCPFADRFRKKETKAQFIKRMNEAKKIAEEIKDTL